MRRDCIDKRRWGAVGVWAKLLVELHLFSCGMEKMTKLQKSQRESDEVML